MTTFSFPWLEFVVGLPLIGAVWAARSRTQEAARRSSIVFLGLTFLMALGAWADFAWLPADHVQSPLSPHHIAGLLVVDELNAPLLAMTSLLYFLMVLSTPRTKLQQASFSGTLTRAALLLGAMSCQNSWAIAILLSLGVAPVWQELRARKQPTGVFQLHMAVFAISLTVGQAILNAAPEESAWRWCGLSLVTLAVLVRSGIAPFHTWMPDLFDRATFGTALMFVVPMPGVYAAARLLLPVATTGMLQTLTMLSLFTAFYAAGMALVQKDARRFFSYLLLSNSALVLVGLDLATPVGLTGSLSLWLSVGIALGGFGLTLRCLEGRLGRISIQGYQGLYEHMPTLAGFFLLTGLASVGFPGTLGFIGAEMILEGAVRAHPSIGMMVTLAAAMNGIAVVLAYLRIFTGTRHPSTINLSIRPNEKIAVTALTVLILGAGLFPQPGVQSRYQAAMKLIAQREAAGQTAPTDQEHAAVAPEENRVRQNEHPSLSMARRMPIEPVHLTSEEHPQ